MHTTRGHRGARITRGGEEALHGVSFRIEPGQTVALVGASGAGKSTIALPLSRLYSVDSGALRFAGTDVREVTFASMRHALDLVTHDGHLFHVTSVSNLGLARPEATDDEVWDAVRRARFEPLVRSLSDPLGPWWASAATDCPAANASE